MTPTRNGRWQTRSFLLATIGLVLTFLFSLLFGDSTPFALLGYVFLFGLAWDVLYSYLQTFRWNHDWPPAFAFLAGIWEGLFLWMLTRWLPLPGVSAALTGWQFLAHYGTVWLVTYAASMSLMHILFPHWRFRGGEWWP